MNTRAELMQAMQDLNNGTFIKAAGPDGKGPRYYEMSVEQIAETVAGFADAADRRQASRIAAGGGGANRPSGSARHPTRHM